MNTTSRNKFWIFFFLSAFHFSISKHGSNIQSQTNHFFLNVIIELSGKNLVSENGEREMKISVERDFGEKFGYEGTERVSPKILSNTEEERKRNLMLLYLYYERDELTAWVWNVNLNGKCLKEFVFCHFVCYYIQRVSGNNGRVRRRHKGPTCLGWLFVTCLEKLHDWDLGLFLYDDWWLG